MPVFYQDPKIERGVTNIITAESKDELPDPATVPEGTIALVPSEEKVFDLTAMGFPVVAEIGETYTLRTDTTEIFKSFASGKVAFSFDFTVAGNKVFVTTGSTYMPAATAVSGSTIICSGAFIVAVIAVSEVGITITTKVLA